MRGDRHKNNALYEVAVYTPRAKGAVTGPFAKDANQVSLVYAREE
jgi:hypothetical protein